MTTYTRRHILAIEEGKTKIAQGFDGRYSEPRLVTRIYASGDDVHGKYFICGYTQFGPDSEISFSIKEGDDARFIRIYQPEG